MGAPCLSFSPYAFCDQEGWSGYSPLPEPKPMNPRLPPHRQKLGDREAKVPTGVESLTGSDPLLPQGDKKLAVRGLAACISWAFRAGSLATTSYQNRCSTSRMTLQIAVGSLRSLARKSMRRSIRISAFSKLVHQVRGADHVIQLNVRHADIDQQRSFRQDSTLLTILLPSGKELHLCSTLECWRPDAERRAHGEKRMVSG